MLEESGGRVSALLFLLLIAIALTIISVKTVILTKEGERIVVFRLGQLLRVYGPGRVIVIPFIDRVVRVRLDSIAGWDGFSEKELEEKVVQKAMRGERS